MTVRGFTLLEMMVALAVLAILAVVGIPSFNSARLSSQLSSSANEFVATVQVARSEAIKRNRSVTLCASADGESCGSGDDWQDGWIVTFQPVGSSGIEVVARHSALPGGWTVAEATDQKTLVFSPTGFGSTTASLRFCRSQPLGQQERVVTITASGSTRVARTQTGTC